MDCWNECGRFQHAQLFADCTSDLPRFLPPSDRVTVSECTSRRQDTQLWLSAVCLGTGCRDNGIRVFRAETQGSDSDALALPTFQMVSHTEEAHAADVNCVAWHPSSRGLLASAGDDRLVRVWQLS